MAIEQDISGWWVGEDRPLLYDVEEDASGWTVEWVAYADADTELIRCDTDGGEISIDDAASGTDHGIRVSVPGTAVTTPGAFQYVLRRIDALANRVLAYGIVRFTAPTVASSGHYTSPDAVLARTGIKPGDLGYDSDDELAAFLESLLEEITDLMNQRMRRDFIAEGSVPRGLNGIAADIAAESVRQMVQTRDTPIVRVDDFAIRMVTSRVFTPDITERLKLYGRTAVTVDVGTSDLEGEALFADDLVEIIEGS